MAQANEKTSAAAAKILKEMLLLGKQRKFGDTLTAEELSQIPGPGLRAMIDDRQIELLGDLEGTAPGREIAGLQRQVNELRDKIDKQVAVTQAMTTELKTVTTELKKLSAALKSSPTQRRTVK